MPYSPWLDAAGASQDVGQSLARLGQQMQALKYQQAMRQQQLLMQYQMNLQRQQLMQAQAQHYGTLNQLNQARIPTEGARQGSLAAIAALNQAKLGSANALGEATWRQQSVPMMNGPTVEQAQSDNFARIAAETARMRALFGQTVPMHNIGEGGVAVNPQGTPMAFGLQREFAPQRPMNVPPGNVMMMPNQQGGFSPSYTNPAPAHVNMGNIDAALVKGLSQGDIQAPGEFRGTNQPSQRDMMLWQLATNRFQMPQMGQAPMPTAAATSYDENNPANPMSQADFDKLSPGDWFVNPADNRKLRKK